MKILSLSLDKKILDIDSAPAKRLKSYSELVDFYYTIVPSSEQKELNLGEKLKVVASGGRNKILQFINIYRCLNKAFSSQRFDVVTVQDPFELALLAYKIARKNNAGLNIQLHGDFFTSDIWRQTNWRNRYRYHIAREVLRKADSIRVVSSRVKQSLVDKLGIETEKIIVFPIYTDQRMRKRQVIKQQNSSFTYLWIGRFVVEKNLELLLKSFKSVVASKPKSLLKLVGAGNQKIMIRKIASDLGLLEKIEIKDWVEDVDSEYARADAYVLSSDAEGWGMVVVEAMRNYLPVVMTNVGCAGEVVINNKNGIVVPVGDKKALAAGMILLQDKDTRRMFRNNIRESLKSLPNKEKTLELYKKSWEMALKKRSL